MKIVSLISIVLVMTGTLVLSSFQAFGQNADDNLKSCITNDTSYEDSSSWANASLDLYSQKKYEDAIEIVDACFNKWASGAVTLQQTFNSQGIEAPPLGDFTPSEKEQIHKHYLLNDVSMALWVKARSLEETDQLELAKKTYSNCIYLTHGRAWDPKGWFWSPSADCVKRGRNLIK